MYFGTDTRLQTLLLGVILAFLWPPFKLKNDPPKVVKYVIDSIGSLSFIVLILLFFIINDETNWIYDGGFYLISILTLLYYCQCRSSIYMDSEDIFKSSVSIYREKVL